MKALFGECEKSSHVESWGIGAGQRGIYDLSARVQSDHDIMC